MLKLNFEGDAKQICLNRVEITASYLPTKGTPATIWEHFLGRNDFTFGQIGGISPVDELLNEDVCIGDCYRLGAAVFELTQPR